MKQSDIDHVSQDHLERGQLTWHSDNRWFVAGFLVPNLKLSDSDKDVLREAYGWPDGQNWELVSDGETLVADWFLDGQVKNPAGVAHDFINRVSGHSTQDGHVWTAWQSNALYRRVQKALGATFSLRLRRWAGLTVSWLWGKLPFMPDWWR